MEIFMQSHNISVSIITIAGNNQFVKNGFLDAVINQTIVDKIELIVFGIDTQIVIPESYAKKLDIKIVQLSAERDILYAQIKGVKMARGTVVAFIEDHCVVQNDWAKWIFDACTKSWDAVTYAFKNGSPDTYCYRSTFLAEYGLFAHPIKSRELNFCPDGNVAYNREKLLHSLKKMNIERKSVVALSWLLKEERFKMYLESKAVVFHKSFEKMYDLFKVHFILSRVFGHNRVIDGRWGWKRRIVYALAIPLFLPCLHIFRILKAMGLKHPHKRNVFMGAPFIFALIQFAAIGEGIGYILKDKNSMQTLMALELKAPRV
jgi:hypothetical protein